MRACHPPTHPRSTSPDSPGMPWLHPMGTATSRPPPPCSLPSWSAPSACMAALWCPALSRPWTLASTTPRAWTHTTASSAARWVAGMRVGSRVLLASPLQHPGSCKCSELGAPCDVTLGSSGGIDHNNKIMGERGVSERKRFFSPQFWGRRK